MIVLSRVVVPHFTRIAVKRNMPCYFQDSVKLAVMTRVLYIYHHHASIYGDAQI